MPLEPSELALINELKTTVTSLAGQLAETAKNQKVLADTFAASKPLDGEALAKTVAENVDKALATRTAAGDVAAKRTAFIAEKLKTVPSFAHDKLGNDPAKWDDEAKAINEAWKAESARLGLKVPDVSGATTGGAAPTTTVDYSKMSADEKIALGLKKYPVTNQVVTAPATAAANATTTTTAATNTAATNTAAK